MIGGGPAGLTAAIYLARFHLPVAVLDAGGSRALLIPRTHNLPGFPDGIGGQDLLQRMRRQARAFGAKLIDTRVDDLAREGQHFRIVLGDSVLRAGSVLLATGVRNLRPDMPQELHTEALARGLLRYCPICDGFEVTDRRIAVLGTGTHALKEARFLRSFSADVTLVAPYGAHVFRHAEKRGLEDHGIACVDGPVAGFTLQEHSISLQIARRHLGFETLYAALGTEVHAELARAAGAQTGKDGSVLVDRHQMTSVSGLYAAGDVVKGLDQIGTAMGQAAIAATAMRNALCDRRPLLRGRA